MLDMADFPASADDPELTSIRTRLLTHMPAMLVIRSPVFRMNQTKHQLGIGHELSRGIPCHLFARGRHVNQFPIHPFPEFPVVGVVGHDFVFHFLRFEVGDVGDDAVPQSASIGQALGTGVRMPPLNPFFRKNDTVSAFEQAKIFGRFENVFRDTIDVFRMKSQKDRRRIFTDFFGCVSVDVEHAWT